MLFIVVVLAVSSIIMVLIVVGTVLVLSMAVSSISDWGMRSSMGVSEMASLSASGDNWGVMGDMMATSSGYNWGVMSDMMATGSSYNWGVMGDMVTTSSSNNWGMMSYMMTTRSGDNWGMMGLVICLITAGCMFTSLFSEILNKRPQLSVLVLYKVDVRLKSGNGRVVSDLNKLNLWSPLNLVLELISFLCMLVEGVSKLSNLFGNGSLFVFCVADSLRIDSAEVFLKVIDLVRKSLILGLELSKMSRAGLEVLNLSL